jgi:hypothetical protein
MDLTNIKYAGEAVFLLGVAYRLLRWAFGAFAEGDAPPSAYADYGAPVPRPIPPFPSPGSPAALTIDDSAAAAAPTAGQPAPHQTTGFRQVTIGLANPSPSPFLLSTLGRLAMSQRDPEAPPHPGDPALFSQSMLDAMTPEQRAQVLSTLAKERSGSR